MFGCGWALLLDLVPSWEGVPLIRGHCLGRLQFAYLMIDHQAPFLIFMNNYGMASLMLGT